MTSRLRLLDCTLRDGGNQNNWRFSIEEAQTVVRLLDETRVDVIEVGYRGGSGSNTDPNAGEAARCSRDYLASLPATTHAALAVMVVPTVCAITELDDLPDTAISMVRVAAYPWDVERAVPFVRRLRELGLRSTVNLMALSYVDSAELARIVRLFEDDAPEIFYVADSFGALLPDQISSKIRLITQEFAGDVGIHVHNNLGLAAANTLAAVDAGATWVDASLCSMARGAGNLATEQAVSIIRSSPVLESGFELSSVLDAADYVSARLLESPMVVAREQLMAGINDHHYYFQPLVLEQSNAFGLDPIEVGRRLGLTRPRSVTREAVTQICESIRLESTVSSGGPFQ